MKFPDCEVCKQMCKIPWCPECPAGDIHREKCIRCKHFYTYIQEYHNLQRNGCRCIENGQQCTFELNS